LESTLLYIAEYLDIHVSPVSAMFIVVRCIVQV